MCASSWFIYKGYTRMHGQQSIQFSSNVYPTAGRTQGIFVHRLGLQLF